MTLKTLLSIAAIAIFSQIVGCAFVPITANLDVPSSENPAVGQSVKIVSVSDNRQFVYPHVASPDETTPCVGLVLCFDLDKFKDPALGAGCDIPSVPNKEDLSNKAMQERAIGRIGRCKHGDWLQRAMVSLPDGQTVSSLVKHAVTEGFKQAGYRVVSDDDPTAIPVNVSIKNLWVASDLDGAGVRYWSFVHLNLRTPYSAFDIDDDQTEKVIYGPFLEKHAQHAMLNVPKLVARRLKDSPMTSSAQQ